MFLIKVPVPVTTIALSVGLDMNYGSSCVQNIYHGKVGVNPGVSGFGITYQATVIKFTLRFNYQEYVRTIIVHFIATVCAQA